MTVSDVVTNGVRPRGRGERLGDGLLVTATALLLSFALGPLLIIAIFSFNSFPYYSLPLRGFTTHWYSDFLNDPRVGTALVNSVEIAVAVAILSTVLGTLAALGLARRSARRLVALLTIAVLPLVTPPLVLALGSQLAFSQTGLPLSRVTVVFVQTTAFTPFVILMVAARLAGFDWRLVAAARDLGGNGWRAFTLVQFPYMRPAVQSGFLIAFLLSLNDYVLTAFTSGGFYTLTTLVYSMQRAGISPMVLAYSTTVVVVAAVAVTGLRSTAVGLARRGRYGDDVA